MTTVTQTISTLSTAPSRADPSTFDSRADTFLGELEDLPGELNTWAGQVNTVAGEVSTNAANAATSETNAETAEAAAIAASGASLYSGVATYNLPDTVIGSDGNTYRCTGTDVTGDNPVGSETGDWLQITTDADTYLAKAGGTVTGDIKMSSSQIQFAKGADVASASALPILTDGNYFDVTGTTTITSINTSGKVGTTIKLHFDGVLTLTHHATDLILPSGGNITTAAGDEAEFVEYASGDWRCTNYSKADGTAVVEPATVTPGMVLLSEINASGASTVDIETTFDSTYDYYIVTIVNAYTSSNGVLYGRVKIGGEYKTDSNYEYHSTFVNSTSTAYSAVVGSPLTYFRIGSVQAGANAATNGTVQLFSPSSTSRDKPILWDTIRTNGSSEIEMLRGGGAYRNEGAITGLRLYPSAGTITGDFRLYGVVT